jgi:hypothetical protein
MMPVKLEAADIPIGARSCELGCYMADTEIALLSGCSINAVAAAIPHLWQTKPRARRGAHQTSIMRCS